MYEPRYLALESGERGESSAEGSGVDWKKGTQKGQSHWLWASTCKESEMGERSMNTQQLAFWAIKEGTNTCSEVLEEMKEARKHLLGASDEDGVICIFNEFSKIVRGREKEYVNGPALFFSGEIVFLSHEELLSVLWFCCHSSLAEQNMLVLKAPCSIQRLQARFPSILYSTPWMIRRQQRQRRARIALHMHCGIASSKRKVRT